MSVSSSSVEETHGVAHRPLHPRSHLDVNLINSQGPPAVPFTNDAEDSTELVKDDTGTSESSHCCCGSPYCR